MSRAEAVHSSKENPYNPLCTVTTRMSWERQEPHRMDYSGLTDASKVKTHRISSIYNFLRSHVGLNLRAKQPIRAKQDKSRWADPALRAARAAWSTSLNSQRCIFRGVCLCLFFRFNRRRNSKLCPVWNKETFLLIYKNIQGRPVHHK